MCIGVARLTACWRQRLELLNGYSKILPRQKKSENKVVFRLIVNKLQRVIDCVKASFGALLTKHTVPEAMAGVLNKT